VKTKITLNIRDWLLRNAEEFKNQFHKFASCYEENDPRVDLDLVLNEAIEQGLAGMERDLVIDKVMDDNHFSRKLRRGDLIIKNDGKVYEVMCLHSIPTKWHGKPGKSMETSTTGYRLELREVPYKLVDREEG